jgi:hypothetical protein
VILEKSVQILILGLTFLHPFYQVLSNCFCGLGVKAFFSNFLPEKLLNVNFFWQKPCQFFVVPYQVSFSYFAKKAYKKKVLVS